MRISFAAAELVYRRLLPGPEFSEPERRLLGLHVDNSFRPGVNSDGSFRPSRMVAVYSSAESIWRQAGILQNHYNQVLNRLLNDRVLQRVSKVAFGLNPEPMLWAEHRRPKPLDKVAAPWNKSATSATPSDNQGEFFEWPTIEEGTRASFLEAAMREIYPSTGAGGEIPGVEPPSSRDWDDDPSSKGCQRREVGTTRTEKPPTPGPEARSPLRPGVGQSVNTTLNVVSGSSGKRRRGAGYHPESGIRPSQVGQSGENTTLAVVSKGNTTLNVVSPEADKQGLKQACADRTAENIARADTTLKVVSPEPGKQGLWAQVEAEMATEPNKIKGEADTTANVVSSKADKQRAECANATLRVASDSARARANSIVIGTEDNCIRADCAKGLCSEEREERLLRELEEALTVPGHKALTKQQARELLWGKAGGKGCAWWWGSVVIRRSADSFERNLGDRRAACREGRTFEKDRVNWLNYYTRESLGLDTWKGVKPIKRPIA